MIKTLSAALLTFFIISISVAQQKILLKLKPDLNNPVPQKVHMTIDVNAGSESSIIEATTISTTTNTAVTDSTLTYSTKYTEMLLEMNVGMMTINYDSKHPDTNEFSKQIHEKLKTLFEKPVVSIMNLNGKVTAVENLPEGNGFFDPNFFKEASVEYPNYALKVGDQWKATNNNENLGQIEQTYTLKSIAPEGILIHCEGNIMAEGKSIGTVAGQYFLSPKTHYLQSATIESKIKNDTFDVTTTLVIQ
ncbi:DUF6263 family protein [Sphingobacterium sp. SRCM116780]|uniref:DUF6263 family protein n=1 Tax=Sphingobacterium sp. SRCM116780 TaxID=2907623 RepID=UPI001F2AF4F3|nr:DUF6263 family protein [Sphingobacterium sp. SRCM116780]UIR55763.1 DUF6263 family protein [Sphingobacterium sp. SRCM116780]